METGVLALAIAQDVAQLAKVVKKRVARHTALHNMAVSIESKAIRSYAVTQELNRLIEVPGIRSILFTHAFKDLNEIQQDLNSIKCLIETRTRAGGFLQAPVLNKSFQEAGSKLTQLEHFFRSIGILGSMISSMQSEMRTLVHAALTSFLPVAESSERIQQFLQNIESQAWAISRTRNDAVIKGEASIALATGLTIYGDRVGKASSAFGPLHVEDLNRAAQFFHKACRLGVKEAYRHLGDLYYEGHGVEICHRTAVELYRKGAARNDAAAKFKLGWCYQFGFGVDKDTILCVKYLREAVDGGSGEAMGELGFLKLHGKIIPTDLSGAHRLLKKAEKMDVFLSKKSLAVCYDKGIGEDRDLVKAFQMYRECFDNGFLPAAQLAYCYDTGKGVERDPRKGAEVFERCMNSGTWHSDFYKACFGLRLIQGNGVERDVARGKAIIIDSTKSGSAYSWNALGECFRYGLGFRKDAKKAKEFYKKAIDSETGVQGVVASYLAMGEIFEYGDGVTASIIQANKYYLAAANRLCPIGQWKVATALENGIGFKKNIHTAVYYFRLCANSGNVKAQRKSVMYYMQGHGVERPREYIRKAMEENARRGSKEMVEG